MRAGTESVLERGCARRSVELGNHASCRVVLSETNYRSFARLWGAPAQLTGLASFREFIGLDLDVIVPIGDR